MARLILLTGASRGLGRAMAQGFAQAGHTVLGCARDPQAVAALNRQLGEAHDFDAVDVADAAQVEAWRDRLLAAYGCPDLLVNNAGLANDLNPLWAVPQAEFDRVIDANIKGVANVIRAFVPAAIARQRGIIVNFSSGWGRSTSPQVGPYCTTKWAIEGMTRSLAQELPAGMAAIPLNPGIIHTDMLETCFGERAAQFTPIEDWAARAVPFLLGLDPKDNGKPLSVPAG
ncbi:MAG: oxidoreductase [Cyanobacteria bacterium QS_8_64_29]|nr:MAG: oxidoreductase [Cyanobacteria bacterium QS_8_64_29]